MDKIDERLNDLEAAWRTFEGPDRDSSPKIQRVPAILRENPKFDPYWTPKIISFGPIHHQTENNLNIGQRYKSLWTFRYIDEYCLKTEKGFNEASRVLHNRIQGSIVELKQLFSDDVLQGYGEEELTWMLFEDGCSLLHYMDKIDVQRPEALELKLDQLMYTWRDILLLENQFPMRVLELLSEKDRDGLEFLLWNFQTAGWAKQSGQTPTIIFKNRPKIPHTILDSCRAVVVDRASIAVDRNQKDESQFWQRYKNIRDLKRAGIRVMANETNEYDLHNISFTSGWFGGELRLPKFLFNDNSTYSLRNMIAYEMCPDFPNDFEYCSYLSFMDFLIDDAEDVKQLRLAGVLENLLGSDEELAKFINEIADDLPTKMFTYYKSNAVAFSEKYVKVKLQIQYHYRNRWKRRLAELRRTHFNTPWSIIAFLAALLVLILTITQTVLASIQTRYTIHPKK